MIKGWNESILLKQTVELIGWQICSTQSVCCSEPTRWHSKFQSGRAMYTLEGCLRALSSAVIGVIRD